MNTTTRRGGCTRRQPCLRVRVRNPGYQQRKRSPRCLSQTRTSLADCFSFDPAILHSNPAQNQIVQARDKYVIATAGVQNALQSL